MKHLENKLGSFLGISETLSSFIVRVLFAILIFLIARIFTYIIDKVLVYISNKKYPKINNAKKKTVFHAFRSFLNFLVSIIVFFQILDLFGIHAKSFIAAAGIGGIAIAFGAQSLVHDMVSGAMILLDNQFNIGDYVKISGVEGFIESVNLRKTIVKDFDGSRHIIPNSSIKIVTNYSTQSLSAGVNIKVAKDINIDKIYNFVENQLLEKAKTSGIFFEEYPKVLGIMDMDSLTYTIRISATSNFKDYLSAQRFIRENILRFIQS